MRVTHYFTKTDCLAMGSELRPTPGGWWMRRQPPAPRNEPAPDDRVDSAELIPAAEIPHLAAPPADAMATLGPRELRDRLATLDPDDDRVGP